MSRKPASIKEAERTLSLDRRLNAARWAVIFAACSCVRAGRENNACKREYHALEKAVDRYQELLKESESGKVIR